MNFFQDFTQMFTKNQFINGALKAKDYLAVGIDKGNRPGSIIKYPEVKIVTMKKIKDFTDQPLKEVLVVGNTTEGKDIVVTAGDDVTFSDTSKAKFGASGDLQIYHDGSNSYIEGGGFNGAGNLIIRHKDDGRDLIFQGDNGDGDSSSTTYFYLNSSMAVTGNPDVYTQFPEHSRLIFGNSSNSNSLDLEIYHDSGANIKAGSGGLSIESKGGILIENKTSGELEIHNDRNSDLTLRSEGDVKLKGSGQNEYFRVDSGLGYSVATKDIQYKNNIKAKFGDGNKLLIYHIAEGDYTYIHSTGTGGIKLDAPAISGTAIKDEDNMVSNSATHLATQQSIKAYVDTQLLTQDTLAEILAVGNTTGGTDIAISANDDITFTNTSKLLMGPSQEVSMQYTSAGKTELKFKNMPDGWAADQVFVENGFMKIGPTLESTESCMHSTIDYFGSDSSDTGNRYNISIHITNKTTGSPDINQTYNGPQDIFFKRQSAAAATKGGLPWNLYAEQYSPAVDSGYDAGLGIPGSQGSGLRVNVEPSTADINKANYSGSSFLSTNLQIYTTDIGTLKSLRLPVSIKIDGNGSSPGNGTLGLRVIDARNSAPNAAMDDVVLPSTVYVYFRDTTLTSSTMGRPPFNLLWAGKDTTFAKFQNSGQTYTAGCDYVFSGNSSAQVSGKYELFFQDEIESQGRFSNLKVTDGRVVMQDLPTSDPVSKGVLWNDNGTLKVSAG